MVPLPKFDLPDEASVLELRVIPLMGHVLWRWRQLISFRGNWLGRCRSVSSRNSLSCILCALHRVWVAGATGTKFGRRHGFVRLEVEPDALSKRKCSTTAGIYRAVGFAGNVLGSGRRAGGKFLPSADGLRRCRRFSVGSRHRDADPVSFSAIEVEYVVMHDVLVRRIRIVAGRN